MATADIVKEAVYDARIVQSRPKFAVEQGALSVTNAPFPAIGGGNTSQQTYNISVPSENVFVDRGVQITNTLRFVYTVTVADPAATQGEPVFQFGRDGAFAAFPIHQLCSTMSATINDTTSTINLNDVLNEVLRLTDFKDNRLQRTCPTALPAQALNDDSAGTSRDYLGSQNQARSADEVGNGAYFNVQFCDPNTGALLSGNGTYADGADTVVYVNGQPVVGLNAGGGVKASYPVMVALTSTENLVLSPFTFSDVCDWDTGLFGIQNIQLILNHRTPAAARVLRNVISNGRTVSGLDWSPILPIQNAAVNVQFLTPSLNIPLPPKSVVPQMEYPRYITTGLQAIDAGVTATRRSQTITLPNIPDLLVIYAKPQNLTLLDSDQYFGIEGATITFDNFSGLLSSTTADELYQISVHNGLEMDQNQWRGRAKGSRPTSGAGATDGQNEVQLTGSILVLKPGQDFALQTGQAPSLVGNFTLQVDLQLRNNDPARVAPLPSATPEIQVVTINSGFFESMSGSSRIIKGVLSEQDIINAPMAGANRSDLNRMVGGQKGVFSRLSNALGKAKELYSKSEPVRKAVKAAAAASGTRRGKQVADAMERYGMGMSSRMM